MSKDAVLRLEPTAVAWADIVLKEWARKVELLGIQGQNLIASFANHVSWSAQGDIQKIAFMFEYVGKFTDMGVGNGVNLDTRDALIAADLTRRRPKPWYTGTIYKQLTILRHLLQERLADNIRFDIARNLKDAVSGEIIL